MYRGTVLESQFRIEHRLGEGGMGEVWRGLDLRLGRPVAVKVLKKNADPNLATRLRREAESLAKLNHPGITVVHYIGDHEGHPFSVMEFLDGQNLRAKLKSRSKNLPVADIVSWTRQAAAALAHAHARGVIHRDIKPANLMLLPDGQVKVCDFGIAYFADATAGLTGGPIGTERYMPPEQWKGVKDDPRIDLYALGATIYALLTGQPPLPHQAPDLSVLRLSTERPDVYENLRDLIERLLSFQPENRPPDAGTVIRILDRTRRREQPPDPPPGKASDAEFLPTRCRPTSPGAPPWRGSDLEVEAEPTLTIAEAMRGGTKQIAMLHPSPCPLCGAMGVGTSCQRCVKRKPHASRAEVVTVHYPAGVRDRQWLCLPGQGGEGSPRGDLYVRVRVMLNGVFGIAGDNLIVTLPISDSECWKGGHVKVPAPGGWLNIELPAGTFDGKTFLLRNAGLTRSDGTRGQLIVEIEVRQVISTDGARSLRGEMIRQALTMTRPDASFTATYR